MSNNTFYCIYCGNQFPKVRPIHTKEHLIPASKGGNTSHRNLKDCCKKCNTFRSNKDYSVFKLEINHYLRKIKNNQIPNYCGYTSQDLETMLHNIEYNTTYIKKYFKDMIFENRLYIKESFIYNMERTDICFSS